MFCENNDSGYQHFDRPYSVRQNQIHLYLSVNALVHDEMLELYNSYQKTIEQYPVIDRVRGQQQFCLT